MLGESFEDGSPEMFSVSIGDTLTIQEGESVTKQAARSVSDELSLEEKAEIGRGAFLFSRRRNKLVVYLPACAT